MPISEIQAALQSLQACRSLISAGLDLKRQLELEEAVRGVNQRLNEALAEAGAAHQLYATVQQERDTLRAEVARLQNWEASKQDYQLEEVAPGVLVRRKHSAEGHVQPAMRLCPTCFEQTRPSVLTFEKTQERRTRMTCPSCKHAVLFDGSPPS